MTVGVETKTDGVGAMRHQVQFLMPLVGRDDTGGESHTWLTSNAVWANVNFKTSGSGEEEIAERVMSMPVADVTMRYRAGIYPKMRLKYDDREFNILTIIEDFRQQYMTLEVVEDEVTRDDYWVDPSGGFWVDPNGDYWVWGGGEGVEYKTVGGLTWTDESGNNWTQT